MGWSEPTDPTGTYDPAYMTNLYGASWDVAWNTSIYGRPMATGANVLSNCVGYAQGRMLRIWMEDYNPTYNPAETHTHPFISYNAEADTRWLTIARSLGHTVSNEPREGSILVTGSHVAVVEKFKDGQWWVSESGYDTMPHWVYHPSLYKSGDTWYSSYASIPKVEGFIYIPDISPGPGPSDGIIYDRKRRKDRYYYNEY